MNDILTLLLHGPPTITLMPNSNPCSETLMCDPTRYNRILEIYNDRDGFKCNEAGNFIDNAGSSQCDKDESGLFLGIEGEPIKALLCYNDGN